MKQFWYLVKQAFIPFTYLFFMAIIAFAILSIEGLIWLKAVLLGLNMALYFFVVCTSAFHDGQKALKVRIANDIERNQIILTGEDRPLKLSEEYKPWKGFAIGLVANIPLIILMVIHTILITAVGSAYTGAGAIAGFIYMMFFAFFRMDGSVATATSFYYVLIMIPIIVLAVGISYSLGAKKIELQQERIKQKHREIYGD